jgi:CelD/BcsL family acetyltransferase involved in cellulose biosynthesis
MRAHCLALHDATGSMIAGLPVIEVRRLVGMPRWVSLPFSDYCPPLVRGGTDADITARLDAARRAFGVGTLEVRAELSGAPAHNDGTFLVHQLPLTGSESQIFATLHANQVRRNIRRAERAGVTVREGTAEGDLTGIFYRLHTRTRHRLGVPVQPRRYFSLLWRRIVQPGHGILLIAEFQGVPVAAAVFLASSGVCVYKYGASDERHWNARPNHVLFWEAIRWAVARGCRTFDFGRTDVDDHGLRDFKSRWGTLERQLSYSVLTDRPIRRGRTGLPAPLRSAIRHSPTVVPRVLGELLYRYAA